MKHKWFWVATAIKSKKTSSRSITISDIKYITKQELQKYKVLAQNRQEDQWNRIDYQGISSHSYNELILNKGAKNIPWIKGCTGKTGYPHVED
jgi:hypothetical protein